MNKPLPTLTMAYECPKGWDDLTGDGRVRQCETCSEPVTNLSALSHSEATEFLARPTIGCVHFARNVDGTIRTRESCWIRSMKSLAAGLLFVATLGCGVRFPGRTFPVRTMGVPKGKGQANEVKPNPSRPADGEPDIKLGLPAKDSKQNEKPDLPPHAE